MFISKNFVRMNKIVRKIQEGTTDSINNTINFYNDNKLCEISFLKYDETILIND